MNRELQGKEHPVVAHTLSLRSATLRHMGRFSESEESARVALAIASARLGPEHATAKEAGGMLGMVLVQQRRWTEAEPLLLAYATALEAKAPVEGDFGEVAEQMVAMYVALGKHDKAAEWRSKVTPRAR